MSNRRFYNYHAASPLVEVGRLAVRDEEAGNVDRRSPFLSAVGRRRSYTGWLAHGSAEVHIFVPAQRVVYETVSEISKHSLICVCGRRCQSNGSGTVGYCLEQISRWFIHKTWFLGVYFRNRTTRFRDDNFEMLGSGSLSRSPTSAVTTSTVATVAVAVDTATSIQIGASAGPASSSNSAPSLQLDKSEINDAVTKVLKGYDWTLVPTATK